MELEQIEQRFKNHKNIEMFKQNANYGEKGIANLFRTKQVRALHWWIHELDCEAEPEDTYNDEREIALLEGMLLNGAFDDLIYS